MSEAQTDTPYRDGGWTVRQIVHHLADSHIDAYLRTRLALTEDWPTVPLYNGKLWSELTDARAMGTEVSLQAIEGTHARWVALFRALSEEEWQRGFVHPENGRKSLVGFVDVCARHGRHHTTQIAAARQRLEEVTRDHSADGDGSPATCHTRTTDAMMKFGSHLTLSVLAFAHVLGAQSPMTDTSAAFDRADRESRTYLATLRCAIQVSTARRDGVFGPVDSLGAIGECLNRDGRWIGVFFDADSTLAHATRISAVDLAGGQRIDVSADTTTLLQVARAEHTAILRGMDVYETANRQFSPTSFLFGGDTIEVWLMPRSVVTASPLSVGGEWGSSSHPTEARSSVKSITPETIVSLRWRTRAWSTL